MDIVEIVVERLAQRLRELSIKELPVRTGQLRRSITVHRTGHGKRVIGTNLEYARAVHDGRPQVTIRPRNKKALFWKGAKHPVKKVTQPARKANPFFVRAGKKFIAHAEDEIELTCKDILERDALERLKKELKKAKIKT